MRRSLIAAVCCTWLVISLAGCGPSVPREELGEVMFELPKLKNVNHTPPPVPKEKVLNKTR